MNVLFDHQIFWYQPYGGISNYFATVMDVAYQKHLFDFEFSTRYSNNRYLQEKPFSKSKPFLAKHSFPGKNSLFFALKKKNEMSALKVLKSGKVDLFHASYFDTYYLGKQKCPFLLNFFDLTMEKFPEMFSPRVTFKKQKEELLKEVAHIITCSENTKKDFIKHYNFDKKDVTVSYLSSSLLNKIDQSKLIIDKASVPGKYILFIGGRDLYKNFSLFAKAVTPLLQKDPKLYIVCAGKALSSTEQAFLSTLGILDRVVCYSVKDHDLAYLYSNAELFVYPSIYEGFGIPIVEAFQHKCPVVLSDASCFPEVASNAGVYFDPNDIDSMRESIEKVLFDEKKRRILTKRGYLRAKDFSVERTVSQTIQAYKKALK